MDKGSSAFLYMIIFSLLLGAAVVFFHPQYNGTMRALGSGEPEKSPIWKSNQGFYKDVFFEDTHGQ